MHPCRRTIGIPAADVSRRQGGLGKTASAYDDTGLDWRRVGTGSVRSRLGARHRTTQVPNPAFGPAMNGSSGCLCRGRLIPTCHCKEGEPLSSTIIVLTEYFVRGKHLVVSRLDHRLVAIRR